MNRAVGRFSRPRQRGRVGGLVIGFCTREKRELAVTERISEE
jgi:hypothetical protein